MDNYLTNLIERMCDTSDAETSSETISWKALREAEKAENADFVPQLISFIGSTKDKKKRDKACFLLGHIAKNTSSRTALDFLIQRIDKEVDKHIISALLDRIADIPKPVGTDLQPLIQAAKNEKWLIRYSAIQALNNSPDSTAETALIAITHQSEDPYDIIYANAVLNKTGTPKAIPYLEKHLTSRKRDVRDSAQYAIDEIKKRN